MLDVWLRDKALPFWASTGFDANHLRFVERLDLHARPNATVPHRVMVQARQIYVFSQAALLGWFPGADIAEKAMRSLVRDYMTAGPSGGFAFAVAEDGRVVSETRDSYAQAFVLLALGSLHKLTGDDRLLSLADSTISFVEKSLIDPKHGGLFDASPVTDTSKRQNPQMHLFEAYLALAETAPRRSYLDRADTMARLFERHLLDRTHRVLLEYFETDWSAHSDPVRGRIFEPGHHFEWIWLLRKYEALSGRSVDAFVDMLDTSAKSCGLNRLGLIYDEVLAGGSAHKRSSRVWPHTEAAKAAVAQHRKGAADSSHIVTYMTNALFAHFLDKPFEGTWIDHLDEDGRAIVDFIPASSLYHLFVAGAEAAAIGKG